MTTRAVAVAILNARGVTDATARTNTQITVATILNRLIKAGQVARVGYEGRAALWQAAQSAVTVMRLAAPAWSRPTD